MITHKGIIKVVRENSVLVSIISESSCSACHSKGSCLVADSTQKEIEISGIYGSYKPGDEVTLLMKEALGYKAVFLGYLLPFAVLVIALIAGIEISGNEITGGFAALISVGIYFITLYFSRHNLKKVFKFELQEINKS